MIPSEADRLTTIRERMATRANQYHFNTEGVLTFDPETPMVVELTVEERDWLLARLDALTQREQEWADGLQARADLVTKIVSLEAQCDALTAERDDERRFAAQAVVKLQQAEATVARLTAERDHWYDRVDDLAKARDESDAAVVRLTEERDRAEANRTPPLVQHAINECNEAHAILDASGAPKTKTVRRIRGDGEQDITLGLKERVIALRVEWQSIISLVTQERDALKHHESLIDARTQRGITDCSTPLFIRVQNIVEQLEKAEARCDALTAEREALRRERDEIRDAVVNVDNVYRREKQDAEARADTAEREVERLTALVKTWVPEENWS
jgi:chromosome segregation ATPase